MKSLTTKLGVVGIMLISCATLNAQTFTIQSGYWNSPATWSNGIVPDGSTGSIIINHKINVSAGTSITVDELTVNDTLSIESGSTVILNNAKGASVDLQILSGGLKVYGKLICRDSATFSGTTLLNTYFYDGSTYEHQYFNTAGTPPTAFWSINSNLEITGYTKTKTLNHVLWSQSFGNVIYNCPGQQSFIELAGRLKTIKGSLSILNTNGKVLRLSLDATTSTTITIGGNLIIDGKSSVWFSRAAITTVFVGGDFRILSTATASSYLTTTGICQVNVEGDFEMNSSSILRFASGTLTGTGTLRVNKNFSFIAGTITVSAGTGAGTVEMKGSTHQSFSSLGLWTSGVKFLVNNVIGVNAQPNSKVEGSVEVATNGKLIFPSANFTLHGNLFVQSGGSIQSNNGTIILAGSANQEIALAGDTLHHITINKTTTATITFFDAANISGTLSVLSLNTTVFSNGNLTLLSSSDAGDSDASIHTLPSGSSLSGDVTIQRYMSGEGRIYRYISSPVSNASVASMMDDFPVTGTFTDPSTGPGIRSANASFFYYDETQLSALGWIPYPSTGLASENILQTGKGYAAYIREAAKATTWDVTGGINQGDIIFPINFTNTSDPINDGWNLVGNPYPSSIDWNMVGGWDKVHINNGIAVRNNGAGNFMYWDGAVGSLGSGRIAKGQSFWIKTNDVNPQLKIKETAKTTTSTSFYRAKNSNPDYLELSIQSSQHNDKSYLRIRDHSVAGYDSLDVVKFPNDFMNLCFEANKILLAISAIDHLDCSQSYPINLSFVKKSDGSFVQSPIGTYQLSANAFGLFVYQEIMLHDNFTNTDFNLASGNYTFSITTDSSSFRIDRFVFHFNTPPLDNHILIIADTIFCDTSPVYKIELENIQKNARYKIFADEKEVASYMPQLLDSSFIEIETNKMKYGYTAIRATINNLCYTRELKTFKVWKQHTSAPDLYASKACNNETTTLHIEQVTDAIAFNWFDHQNNLLGQTLNSSFIVPIQKPSTFYASSVFDHGCVSGKTSVHANYMKYDLPVIMEDQGILYSNYLTNNKWSLDDFEIPGGNQFSIEPTRTGKYTVTIMNDHCIDSVSYYFIYQDTTCHVFPNPIENDVQIISPKEEQLLQIEIINGSGQSIKTFFVEPNSKRVILKIDDIVPGIYSLNVLTLQNRYRLRILKK